MIAAAAMARWSEERRARYSAAMSAKWQEPDYRARTTAAMSAAAREENPPLTEEQAADFVRLVRAGHNGREVARALGTSYWRVCSHAFGLVQRTLRKPR